MRSFVCAICEKPFPMSMRHEHHKIPKSLGGSDDPTNLVGLDHACHNNLHMIAFMAINQKRKGEIEPVVHSICGSDVGYKRRLLEYAQIVAKEIFLKKEIRKDPKGDSRQTFELPNRWVELLRLSGYDRPHRNGKPSGVARIIRGLVRDHLIRSFPRLKDEILAAEEKD